MGYSEIWAPWRLDYIQGLSGDKKKSARNLRFPEGADPECFICQAAADTPENDRHRLVIFRGENCLVIMNKFPYNNGHLLITPQRHLARFEMLTPAEHMEMMGVLEKLIRMLEASIHPHGFNVGLNLGTVAGAGLPGHLHWHLVPRWNGDTNFMPVLACVNVISQSLEALWEVLHKKMNE